MLFNSWGYVLFLLVGVALHWALPQRWRIGFLCFASMLFYAMWRWEFCLLVIFSAAVDFFCGKHIARATHKRRRRAFLLLSLVTNLGLLGFFKYTYFALDNLKKVGALAGLTGLADVDLGFSIILPLGISFYTFQTISYSIDVYRGVIRPIDRFPLFLAYVMFWPQLVAGPILRAGEVVEQLERPRTLDWRRLSGGLSLVVLGLFKKVVLADNIAPMVELWYEMDPNLLTGIDVWVANFLFGFQIYCDFSGYSDIAIGSAAMVGLTFPDNFNWPYMSRSPREFWRRWHISLSSWIRDYLYLPLTGREFQTRSTGGMGVASQPDQQQSHAKALLLTWLIMGLWHGAAWTFALWGLYHGLVVLLYRVLKPLQKLVERAPPLAWLLMLHVAMAGWIPFRAASLRQALAMFAKILNPTTYRISGMVTGMSLRLAGYSYLWAALLPLGMVAAYFARKRTAEGRVPPAVLHPAKIVVTALMVCLILISMQARKQFIYFQF